ncbi:MAG: lectin like domain-containing protein, partial [Acutalibacteraceae bacterium]
NEPIALKADEKYSVVVKLANPNYPFPIPTEASFFEYDKTLKYTAKGGESYFSADGEDWHDIIEVNENEESDYMQVSNVCLKAFTNPIPQSGAKVGRVQFSVPEGQIAVGDTVELIGNGDIYYTVTDKNGVTGEATKYTDPIVIEDECTIAAWIKDGDKDGDVNKNTYTVAKSQLIEMFVQQAGNKTLLNLQNGETELEIDDIEYGKPITIMPHGSGNITVNGKAVKSDEWSDEIMLNPAVENTITVVSSEDGKTPTAYTIRVTAKALNFDYNAKTVSFDDTLVSVKDPDGKNIASGDSIEKYITNSGETPTELAVTHLDSEKETTERVAQKKVLNNKIQYINTLYESTVSFSSAFIYADNPLMAGAKSFNNSSIPLKPGQTLYIQRMQDSSYLESNVYKLDVPERPETPTAQIEKVSADGIKLKYVKGAEYRIKGDMWQDSCVFNNVDFSQDYTLEVRIKATDRVFASEIATVEYSGENAQYITVVYRNSADNMPYMRESVPIFEGKNTIRPNKELASDGYFKLADSKQTATVNLTKQDGELVADTDFVYFDVIPSVNPADYSYEVLYFDRSGEQIDRKTVPYSYVGATLQSEIPVPEGYHIYDADNSYYTALRPISGKWRCIYNKQAVIVEKDTVIYGDADGDGIINMLDVLLIRKFIAKQPVTPDVIASDVTHDGTVNMLDVLKIRKYIAKQPIDLANAG